MIGLNDSQWVKQLNAIKERAFQRLLEIEAERAQILAAFPDLKGRVPKGKQGRVQAVEPAVMYEAPIDEEPEAIPPRKRRPRRTHSDELRAATLKRIEAGEYVTDLAAELDIGESVIRRWAEKADVTITEMPQEERIRRHKAAKEKNRTAHAVNGHTATAPARQLTLEPPGKRKTKHGQYTEEQRAEAVRRVNDGGSQAGVARAMGIPKATIRSWLDAAGYVPKENGGGNGDHDERMEIIDRKVTVPTLKFIAGSRGKAANASALMDKFELTRAGAAFRLTTYFERGLLNRMGGGYYELTEAGRALVERMS